MSGTGGTYRAIGLGKLQILNYKFINIRYWVAWHGLKIADIIERVGNYGYIPKNAHQVKISHAAQ